jgi:hypothetical protein
MVRHHGKGYDWQHTPLDPAVMHASGGRKDHQWRDHYFLNFVIVFN